MCSDQSGEDFKMIFKKGDLVMYDGGWDFLEGYPRDKEQGIFIKSFCSKSDDLGRRQEFAKVYWQTSRECISVEYEDIKLVSKRRSD